MKSSQFIYLFEESCVLTTAQLAHLLGTSEQMARRHLRQLKADKLIVELPRQSKGRGRPKSAFILNKNKGEEYINEHQIALNWCRIYITTQKCTKVNKKSFLTHHSPELRFKVPTSPQKTHFRTLIPDGAFVLEINGKSLLFFLEMDMGTEPLRASKEGSTDFMEKLDAYRVLFATKGYRTLSDYYDADFIGFRLLVVANTSKRLESLTRLVNSEPFCGFISLVELKKLQDFPLENIQKTSIPYLTKYTC